MVKLSTILFIAAFVDALSASHLTGVKDDNKDQKPKDFVFVFTALAFSMVYRSLLKFYNITLPYPVFLMISGVIVGITARHFNSIKIYTRMVYTNPAHLLTAFLPVLVFKTALFIDAHTFVRSWVQITLISIPGVIIAACFVGVITAVITANWSYTVGMLFGTICTPVYPVEIEKLFREIGHNTKHVEVLLEGEALMGTSTVIILTYILLGIHDGIITTWYHIMDVFLRYICGGMLFGYLLGRICSCIIRSVYNDSVNVITVTMVFAYIGFFVSETVLYVSGVLTVIGIGVLISIERASLATDVETFLLYFWELATYIVNSIIFFVVGVLVTEYMKNHLQHTRDYAKILVTYMLALIGRFVAFIVLAPILSRVGYGLDFPNMTVAVWGGLRGAVTFCLALIVFHHSDLQHIGNSFILNVSGLVFLTLLINASTMRVVLNVLGLSEISLARKANMNNCLKCVSSRRERTISILKMDRFLSDANWPLVNTATVMKHPYKMNYDSDDENETYLIGYRLATCPECKKEVLSDPTPKEFAEMTREARMRILKAKKISFARQYENGMMSKASIRVLRQAVETAMDTPEAVIEIEGLLKLFRKESFIARTRRNIVKVFFERHEKQIKPPRKYWRRICYHIIARPSFEYFMYLMIILNTIPISLEMALNPKTYTPLDICLKALNAYFFLVYLFEFLLKIFGYSWIYICKDGFKTYFSSCWNVFDFTVLLAAFTDIIMDILELSQLVEFDKTSGNASKVTLTTKLLRIIRLIRLLRLCKAFYPRVVQFINSKIDAHMAFAYDVGKGFVTGEEEVSEMLNQMIDNQAIREDMKMRLEADRLTVTKELGLVQKDRPWIAITVKTKQAIRSTLNSMHEAIVELKVAGWLDDFEYMKLMEAHDELLRHHRSIKSVQPSTPEVVFKEVSWMAGDEEIIAYLYENVKTRYYDPGEVICSDGLRSEGIYIVVTGLLKQVYVPRHEVLEEIANFGALPVIDFISSTRFNERIEDYIVSGNSFGELSVVTRRPYNCMIIADTPTQIYVLTHEVIQEAMKKSSDHINGLECRLWNKISMRLALAILMEVPVYQSLTQEKIKYELERAFIPNITNYKVFVVNEMMEDVILIQGIVVDYNTYDVYTAPVYIPRTVQKLILPKSSLMNVITAVETKLLILPTKDVDEYEIMEQEDEVSEMVSTASSKCLQHTILSRQKRQKRKRMYSIGTRKTKSFGTINSSKSRSTYFSSTGENERELQTISMSTNVNIANNQNMVQSDSVSSPVPNVNEEDVTIFISPYTGSGVAVAKDDGGGSSKSTLKTASKTKPSSKDNLIKKTISDGRSAGAAPDDLISEDLSANVDQILKDMSTYKRLSVSTYKLNNTKNRRHDSNEEQK